APQNVANAVAIEVAGPQKLNVRRNRAVEIRSVRREGAVVRAKPVKKMPGHILPPQDVLMAITVEVASANHSPFGADVRRKIRRVRCKGAIPSSEPVKQRTRVIAPQNVRHPVAIEVVVSILLKADFYTATADVTSDIAPWAEVTDRNRAPSKRQCIPGDLK